MTSDVIVVGAGVVGLCAAVELAERGQRVTLLDQFAIPHKFGSSHGETRVIRTAYFEHPDYVPLAQRAWAHWEEPGELLLATGGMYLGRPDSALISGSIEAATNHGLSYEVKMPDDIRAHYPQVSIPDDYVAFVEKQCGVLLAEKCIGRLLLQACSRLINARPNEAVMSWSASAQGVSVKTKTRTFDAARLVICAGPWSSGILRDLNVPLTVTRQIVGFTAPTDPKQFTMGTLPVMCMEAPDGAFYYTIPICRTGGRRSDFFKAARHNPGLTVTPSSVNRATNPEDAESFLPGLREFLHGAAGPVAAMDVCLYTNTPDGHFVVDKHPEHDNVVFACGFSGHGFKFAPVIGEALADLALEGKTALPVGFLGVGRFAAN